MSVKKTKFASQGKDPNQEAASFNPERDCQRFVSKLGLTLQIDVQQTHHECDLPNMKMLTTYHVRPVRHFLENNPEILGGHTTDASDNFKAFWMLYQQAHPSHQVFQHHGQHLEKVVPLLIHGDEGRAVKKNNYLVISIESPLGSLHDARVDAPCFFDFT